MQILIQTIVLALTMITASLAEAKEVNCELKPEYVKQRVSAPLKITADYEKYIVNGEQCEAAPDSFFQQYKEIYPDASSLFGHVAIAKTLKYSPTLKTAH